MHSLNSVLDMISLDISDKVRLFDSMVLPILCYGLEVLEIHNTVDKEREHTNSLKQLMGIRQHTSNAFVCNGTVHLPLYVYRHVNIIN